MRNITEDLKKVIAIDTLWSVNEFHVFLEAATCEGLELASIIMKITGPVFR